MQLVEFGLTLTRPAFSPRERAWAGHLWRLFQDAAIEGSTRRGWPPSRYREIGSGFVVRRMVVVHHSQAVFGDAVDARTWVGSFRRGMFSERQIRLTATSPGGAPRPLASATQQWVYVAAPELKPTRAPQEMVDAFDPGVLEGDVPPALPPLEEEPERNSRLTPGTPGIAEGSQREPPAPAEDGRQKAIFGARAQTQSRPERNSRLKPGTPGIAEGSQREPPAPAEDGRQKAIFGARTKLGQEPHATFAASIETWFTAMDALGHANHPAYVDWADEALARWLAASGADPFDTVPLGEEVTFRSGIVAPEPVRVELARVGTAGDAVVFQALVKGGDGRECAEVTLHRTTSRGPGPLRAL